MPMTTAEKIAVMQAFEDGKPIETLIQRAQHAVWERVDYPLWNWSKYDYRVAVTKPSIDWSHVSDQINAMMTDPHGQSWLTETIPYRGACDWLDGGNPIPAEAFASFVPGNCDWRNSLVVRPGYVEATQ